MIFRSVSAVTLQRSRDSGGKTKKISKFKKKKKKLDGTKHEWRDEGGPPV